MKVQVRGQRFLLNARHLIFLLGIFFCFHLAAQNAAADTIRRQLASLKPDAPGYPDTKIGMLGTLYLSIVHTNPEEAMKVSDQLAACLKEKGDSVKYFEALYRHKAIAYQQMGDYTNNILYLEEYAAALNRIGKSDGYAYIDLGNAYFGLGLRVLAKDCYRHAEAIFKNEKNVLGQCTVYNNYGQIYLEQQQYDSALYEFRRTYNLRVHVLKDAVIAGDSKYLIAACHENLHHYDSAKYYYRSVLSILRTPGLQAHTDHVALQDEYAGAYNRMAGVFISEKQWDSAAFYLRYGFAFYQGAGYTRKAIYTYGAWARLYLGKGMPDSALANIRRFEEKTAGSNNPDAQLRVYDMYADYFKLQNDNENYYRYKMKYFMLEDSLKEQSVNEGSVLASGSMTQLKNKSRIEEQNVILARQQKEKIILFAFSGLLFVVILAGFVLYFQTRKKNRIIQRFNSELKEANATKEKFLSVISHDLRTPFNTLIGMSDIMMQNIREHKTEKLAANAEAINESSRKAFVLLDNLMQWVTLQKEKIIVRKAEIPVAEMAETLLLSFRDQALANHVMIREKIHVSHIYTDTNLLLVIFRNLLSNAIRHIPPGGKVDLIITAGEKDVTIVVEDNGRGIEKEKLKNLFGKKDHTSVARKGGGLGLLLVNEFVVQLDGTITAENIPSGGAKFTVVLKNAAVKNSSATPVTEEEFQMPEFSEQEKKRMNDLYNEVTRYEMFDTTEIRECLEKFDTSGSPALQSWIKDLSLALYHANNDKFQTLIRLAA